jgi:hypothetical protein
MHAPSIETRIDLDHHTGTARLARAILAGFVATLSMLFLFLVAYNLARLLTIAPVLASPAAEIPRRWLEQLTHNRLIDAGLADVYAATAIYLAGGLLWAVVYALVEPKMTRVSDHPWVRGAVFGLVPGLLSLVVVLPILGGGLFGLALGAGPLPIIGNLLLHLAYGAILGIVYGPFGDRDASTLRQPLTGEDALLASSYERMAAAFLLGGLVIGALAGILIGVVDGDGPVAHLAGGSYLALILWSALLGGACGLLVGSFLGAGEPGPRDHAV